MVIGWTGRFEALINWFYDILQVGGLIVGYFMKMFSALVEIIGISIVSIGIGVEIITHADIGYVIMSVGSVVIAMGGLLYAKIAKD